MIVVGIDPSLTSAGVAILTNGQPTHLSHHGYPGHNSDTYRTRSRRVRHQVRQVTKWAHHNGTPDLIIIEEHPYAIRISASEFDRAGLWHGIYGQFDAHNIPVAVIANNTTKKWITGKGNATKNDVWHTVSTWWPNANITCDDESDALALAAIGAAYLGDPMPFDLKDRHRTTLEVIAWPTIA